MDHALVGFRTLDKPALYGAVIEVGIHYGHGVLVGIGEIDVEGEEQGVF